MTIYIILGATFGVIAIAVLRYITSGSGEGLDISKALALAEQREREGKTRQRA